MAERSLAQSFGHSLTEEVSAITGEYAELGIDALAEDGLFKDIPIVSTAIAVYRIGKSVRERHHIAKLISFLNELNNGIVDEKKRQHYREKFVSDEKYRNQELAYILILTDRYIDLDKPQMLAKLYLAYLNDAISWPEFTKYAEIIDRLICGDIRYLNSGKLSTINSDYYAIDSVLRLQSTGLVSQNVEPKAYVDSETLILGEPIGYLITPLGEKLIGILEHGDVGL